MILRRKRASIDQTFCSVAWKNRVNDNSRYRCLAIFFFFKRIFSQRCVRSEGTHTLIYSFYNETAFVPPTSWQLIMQSESNHIFFISVDLTRSVCEEILRKNWQLLVLEQSKAFDYKRKLFLVSENSNWSRAIWHHISFLLKCDSLYSSNEYRCHNISKRIIVASNVIRLPRDQEKGKNVSL